MYATKLAEQESQIAKLHDQQGDVQQKRTTAQDNLNTLMERMEF
jgi:uncharacterized coiled-coil protein SlyX